MLSLSKHKRHLRNGLFKTVIFIHGCFWHGHEGCKYYVIPQTRRKWWTDKIRRNKQLDTEHIRQLKHMGWKIVTAFECQS
ncbi:MAG: hypothetical protein HZA17_04290 [Nitrospirae bacterium]|nr:hypothetical protein [Nitrospirota bacterium]